MANVMGFLSTNYTNYTNFFRHGWTRMENMKDAIELVLEYQR
jgi:hypothetical protein